MAKCFNLTSDRNCLSLGCLLIYFFNIWRVIPLGTMTEIREVCCQDGWPRNALSFLGAVYKQMMEIMEVDFSESTHSAAENATKVVLPRISARTSSLLIIYMVYLEYKLA